MRPHRSSQIYVTLSPGDVAISALQQNTLGLWDVTTVEDCLAEPIGATAADEATV